MAKSKEQIAAEKAAAEKAEREAAKKAAAEKAEREATEKAAAEKAEREAAAKKAKPAIRVTCRKESFIRAGIIWTREPPTTVLVEYLTQEQLAAIRAEPMLIVEDVTD